MFNLISIESQPEHFFFFFRTLLNLQNNSKVYVEINLCKRQSSEEESYVTLLKIIMKYFIHMKYS